MFSFILCDPMTQPMWGTRHTRHTLHKASSATAADINFGIMISSVWRDKTEQRKSVCERRG